MKTIAIIPARGGSKRLPGKNILRLGNIPLIVHSILYAKANNDIVDEVYVSTDDAQIKAIALEYGAKVIDRPKAISGDSEPTVSALRHVLDSCGAAIDNVILLQATNPLRPESLLRQCYESFKEAHCGSLFTVTRSHQKFGKINHGAFVPFNYTPGQRSQDLEPLYFENGLLYICKADVIRQDTIISKDAFPFVVDHLFAGIDIDTREDFEYAKYVYQSLNSKI